MTYRFVNIDKAFIETHFQDMIQMDNESVSSGFLEKWNYTNFITDLPDKWHISGALLNDDIVVSYRIMSAKSQLFGFAHSHRTVVRRDFRRKGLGNSLFNMCANIARRRGYIGISLSIHRINTPSKLFYKRMGLRQIGHTKNGNELWAFRFDGKIILSKIQSNMK